MDLRDRAAPTPTLGTALRACGERTTRVQWCLMLLTAASLHAVAGSLVCLLYTAPERAPAGEALIAASMLPEELIEEDLVETEEDTEEVHEIEIVAEEPVVRDEEIADDVEHDSELPYEESFGSSDGLSDAPFEGPANNGTIGMGGGVGGTFSGRGGSRSLGSGGGGRICRTWRRSNLVPHTSRIRVGDREELQLRGLHATVRVEGFRARVVVDCFYFNDLDRQVEGNFQIRLPNDASPYFFAFGQMVRTVPLPRAAPKGGFAVDVDAILAERAESWTRPSEARMVPRAQAARAYGEVVRRRVDPALLEWSGADVFSARVFPLGPQKLHRVVLGYEVNLLATRCFLDYALELPEEIPDLVVDVHTRDPRAVVTPAASAVNGHRHYWNPSARRFTVRSRNPGALLMRGRDDGAHPYFAARFEPTLPREAAAPSPRAVFLVDVSLSSHPERFNVWLALLEAVLERNRPGLREFRVGFFNVGTTWWRSGFVPNTPANVRAVLFHARRLALEGATDLEGALRNASQNAGAFDLFLLSDGATTWGEDDDRALDAALGQGRALFAYQTGLSGTDAPRLKRLAAATGGAVFSVPGEDRVAAAATAHTMRPWRIDGAAVEHGRDLLLEGRPRDVYPGQELLLVGRGAPARGAVVTLRISRGLERRVVRTRLLSAIDSDLAPRIYGQVAVGQLESFDAIAPDVKRAYATHFRVVGKTCSLLMLESEADYQAYGIVPADEARVVRAGTARAVLARAEDAQALEHQDARASFLRRLRAIRKAARGDPALPEPLRARIAALDAEAFRVAPRRLRPATALRAGLSSAEQAALRQQELSYDAFTARAAQLASQGRPDAAVFTLSSLVERAPGDVNLLRDLAFQAHAWGYGGHAFHLMRRAATLRPHQPQNLAAMADGLAAAGRLEAAVVCYEAALAHPRPTGVPSFPRCTKFDYAHLLSRLVRDGVGGDLGAYAVKRLAALRFELGVESADLVVTIRWNTDRTDVDLHVREPGGEECCYNNKTTKNGGRITADVTGGFGPETYLMREAKLGTYAIRTQYYASDRQRASARSRVVATIYEDWGRPDVKVTRRCVLLEKGKDEHPIAEIVRR